MADRSLTKNLPAGEVIIFTIPFRHLEVFQSVEKRVGNRNISNPFAIITVTFWKKSYSTLDFIRGENPFSDESNTS